MRELAIRPEAVSLMIPGSFELFVSMRCPGAALESLGSDGTVLRRQRVMLVRDVQPSKAHDPIVARAGGSVMSVRDVHCRKAHPPIAVRAGGSVISAKDEQYRKADTPIAARAGGSVISAKDVQL